MKITANARELASALALAASLSDNGRIRKIAGLGAVRLTTVDDGLTIAADVLDFAITLTVPAVVESLGEVAVSASRLSALAAGFLPGAAIEIQSDGTVCRVGSGRSHFKLPTIAPENLPAVLRLDKEVGSAALAREEAVTLLVRPAFAASTDNTRIYLGGVLLHDHEGALTAVATDGHRLARTVVAGTGGLSSDFRLIAPNAALKIIAKLLADKGVERITLRRSPTLLSVEASRFVFVSKLIDADFPNYTRLIPEPPGNTITVDRIELLRALDRVAAVAEPGRFQVAGLTWTEDEPALRLCLINSDGADDVIEAEVSGRCRTATQIHLLAEMLDKFEGQRVSIASAGAMNPILLLDTEREDFVGLQMPYYWPERRTEDGEAAA
jgi:DNA polymerase III subunit beta